MVEIACLSVCIEELVHFYSKNASYKVCISFSLHVLKSEAKQRLDGILWKLSLLQLNEKPNMSLEVFKWFSADFVIVLYIQLKHKGYNI